MPKRVGFLYDKMVDRDFIRRVILDSARYRHSRHDVAAVLADLDKYVERAYTMLALGTYTPSRPKEKTIYDASCQKYRKIKMVPYWPDGIMQWLLVAAMKPVLMRGMYHWSCASIPGRGTKRVHNYLQRAVRRDPKGTRYASEIDVRPLPASATVTAMRSFRRPPVRGFRSLPRCIFVRWRSFPRKGRQMRIITAMDSGPTTAQQNGFLCAAAPIGVTIRGRACSR